VGTNSGDNGIEVNAMMRTSINNAVLEGATNYLLFFNNYRMPVDIKTQTFNVTNTNWTLTYPNSRAFSFGLETTANIRLGNVQMDSIIATSTVQMGGPNGMILNLNPNGSGSKEAELISVKNLTVNIAANMTVTSNCYGALFTTKLINNSNVVLSNIKVNLAGSIAVSGNPSIYPRLVEFDGGSYNMNVNGFTVNSSINYTNLWGMYFTNSQIGNIDVSNYNVISTNTNFTALCVSGNVFSTGNNLSVVNSDFSKISSGLEVYKSVASQATFIHFSDTRFINGSMVSN